MTKKGTRGNTKMKRAVKNRIRKVEGILKPANMEKKRRRQQSTLKKKNTKKDTAPEEVRNK